MEAVGETIQFLVFIKARGVRARRVSVFPQLMVLSELIDGAALNIKLTVLQGLLFREIFFSLPPRQGISLDWGFGRLREIALRT